MIGYIPSEMSIGGVLLPPVLLAGIIGFGGAWGAMLVLKWTRWIRFFWRPSLVFLAGWTLLSVVTFMLLTL
jgi:hypothetical protein